MVILTIFALGVVAFMLATAWKIFTKAGKPGWACIVPIYSILVLLEIVGKPWWWILMFCIPVVNVVFAIWTVNMLSKSFGQTEGFTVGLLLLGIVFYPLLAFGDPVYQGPAGLPKMVPVQAQ